MRCALVFVVAALLTSAVVPSALAHSAFLGSAPEPGRRLTVSPSQVSLTFTESLNERLSRARIVRVTDGRVTTERVSAATGRRLVLELPRALGRGAYRVEWHTVSTQDGHALEGSFSFGVRASAVDRGNDVEQSPLARDGWLRVLARGLMYATLLLFSGSVLLEALLRRRGGLWLAPPSLSPLTPRMEPEQVVRRYWRLVYDIGFLAAGAAALSAVAEASDAAGGLSARGLSDFLLSNLAGLTRVNVVALVLLTGALAMLRLRVAALTALAALAAVALSGHANAASPRGVAVVNDWVHLSATALWLGGIAAIVLVWWPVLRRGSQSERLEVARHVLPVFGRVALPAFAVVVVSGLVSAIIELGHLAALWETGYGRVLMVKIGLVGFIAMASYLHARRLRPRLLAANPHPDDRLERRHWRLLRAEPLLGLGVVCAVALLVAFPLPPRQLGAADAKSPRVAACDPCPLPRPARGELAVAEQGGSDVVAAWMHRAGGSLVGTVRLYGLDDRPARDPFEILSARQTSCGIGCARFRLTTAPAVLAINVRQEGRTFMTRLPARWQHGRERRARRLVERAQQAMRALRSVREVERVSSVPGLYAITRYALGAPDRMMFRTNRGVQSVVVGETQWARAKLGLPWHRGRYGGGLPFRTRSWFTWETYARHAYLLGEGREGGRRVAVVALMDPGTPAWWRLSIDLGTGRVRSGRLATYGHFMTERFSAFNRAVNINPPGGHRAR